VFLSEAFTRPAILRYLAKLGFSQSYTYFTWRNTAQELTEYLTELTQTEVREYLRPNLFANTPDILHAYLQDGGQPAFQIRLILAAMLGASYGIYGPAFELFEGRALRPGSEEYLDSEKYQLRHWDIDRADSLRALIARLNRIRAEHPALREMRCLRFMPVDNEHLLCFSKVSHGDGVVVVVNLDPQNVQSGWVELSLEELGIVDEVYPMHDLISDERYQWSGSRNYVRLDPRVMPAHIFRWRQHVRDERDVDFYA
jgi:starch synthase (maltosyl-transferring)